MIAQRSWWSPRQTCAQDARCQDVWQCFEAVERSICERWRLTHRWRSSRRNLVMTRARRRDECFCGRTQTWLVLWTVHPQIQHVQSCTAWSHFITRTRVAQELQGSGLHIFVASPSTSSLSHPSHLPLLSFPTVSPTHTRSMVLDPYFTLRCSTAEWRINTNPISYKYWSLDTDHYRLLLIHLVWYCFGSCRATDGHGGCSVGRKQFDRERSWTDNTDINWTTW